MISFKPDPELEDGIREMAQRRKISISLFLTIAAGQLIAHLKGGGSLEIPAGTDSKPDPDKE